MTVPADDKRETLVTCRQCGEPVGLRDSRCHECECALPQPDDKRETLHPPMTRVAVQFFGGHARSVRPVPCDPLRPGEYEYVPAPSSTGGRVVVLPPDAKERIMRALNPSPGFMDDDGVWHDGFTVADEQDAVSVLRALGIDPEGGEGA